MKKVFISQPVRGKTDQQILEERRRAIIEAGQKTGETVEVIDSYFNGSNGKPLEILAKSIALLAQADIAYFAPGWKEARGCRIEHQCAAEYGIRCIE